MSHPNSTTHIRLARPSINLQRAETFYVAGLGLSVLYRLPANPPSETEELLMLGYPGAQWHLELVQDHTVPISARVLPVPTEEDLLVLYLDTEVSQELVAKLERNGGKRVKARNHYWDVWGVTVEDPDGYRVVLCKRGWENVALKEE